MTAEQMAALIETKILLPNALAQAKQLLAMTSPTSDRLEEIKAELAATQARWDAEAPVREARERLNKLGWSRSSYDPKVWVKKGKNGWIKKTLIEAIRATQLAD